MRDNMVNSSNTSSRLVILLFWGYICGVKGAITSPPKNTATKVGSQTYLNCSGNNSVPCWKFGEQGMDVVLIELGSSCSVSSNYLSRYRGEGQGSNTCNLIVLNPSLQESGIYSCQDLNLRPKYAVLTVLSSTGTPTVNNGSEVVEGDQLTMTCAVDYSTVSETLISVPIAPNLYWTTSGISITNAVTAKTNVSVTSSITVVATRDGIPSYDCTAHFLPPANKPDSAPNAPSNVYLGGTYQITGIYYGPMTPNVSRRTVNVTANSDIVCSFIELTCNSSANPSPSYTWTNVITRNIVATGNVLALAEDNRTYQCTVSNKVNSSSATFTTGISQPRHCVHTSPEGYTSTLSQSSTRSNEEGDTSLQYQAAKTAAIILGVLFGVALLVIGALIVFIILRKIPTDGDQNTKTSNTRGQNSWEPETVNYPMETSPSSAYQELNRLPYREQPNQYERLTPDTQYINIENSDTNTG